jgi:hypothetical protein
MIRYLVAFYTMHESGCIYALHPVPSVKTCWQFAATQMLQSLLGALALIIVCEHGRGTLSWLCDDGGLRHISLSYQLCSYV